jgi:hypothetical protein
MKTDEMEATKPDLIVIGESMHRKKTWKDLYDQLMDSYTPNECHVNIELGTLFSHLQRGMFLDPSGIPPRPCGYLEEYFETYLNHKF